MALWIWLCGLEHYLLVTFVDDGLAQGLMMYINCNPRRSSRESDNSVIVD